MEVYKKNWSNHTCLQIVRLGYDHQEATHCDDVDSLRGRRILKNAGISQVLKNHPEFIKLLSRAISKTESSLVSILSRWSEKHRSGIELNLSRKVSQYWSGQSLVPLKEVRNSILSSGIITNVKITMPLRTVDFNLTLRAEITKALLDNIRLEGNRYFALNGWTKDTLPEDIREVASFVKEIVTENNLESIKLQSLFLDEILAIKVLATIEVNFIWGPSASMSRRDLALALFKGMGAKERISCEA